MFDVIVVGGGIFGSCAAYHCQRKGLKTLLVEQYQLGHKNGSSHGKSRIIRYAHPEAQYIPVVQDSYNQIAALEAKRNTKLWKNCGLLYFTNPTDAKSISSHLNKYGCDNTIFNNQEIAARYPQFKYDNKWAAVFDPKGGVLYADKWLTAFQDEFWQLGGTIIEGEKVLSYKDQAHLVELSTTNKKLVGRKVIFTVGPWLQQLVPSLVYTAKSQPLAVCVTYWKPKIAEDIHLFTEDKMPVVIMDNKETGEFVYGLPNVDYADSIKFGFHGGDNFNIGDDTKAPSSILIEKPRRHLQEHLPLIDTSAPAHVDRCKYTMSTDEHYVIDRLPGSQNIFVSGCCSGTGFKVAPAIGKALSNWVVDEAAPFDLSFFSLSRFEKSRL